MSPIRILAVSILVLAGPIGAQEAMKPSPAAPIPLHFLTGIPDVGAILPPPPEAGSPAAQADLETVLQVQAWRTPEQVAWAKAVDKGGVFDFSEVLGPWFTAANLPTTARFFRELSQDLRGPSVAAKKRFDRPRPFKVDTRVQPCIDLPDGGSYPSGHALYLFAEAEVLMEIFPDQRAALATQARRSAWGRIFAGVHFPTDLIGGRLLAEALVKEMRRSEAFRRAVEACRKEAEPFRMKKAG